MTYSELSHSAKVSTAMRTPVGDRIRRLRKEREWTQEQLATKAGLRRTHLTAIETGAIQMPDTPTLNVIAGALGVSLGNLLADTPIRVIDDRPSPEPSSMLRPPGEFRVIDFHEGLVEVPIVAEVACGEPMDYSVQGEGVLVPKDYAPDDGRGEYLVRARGDSMVEYGIHDGWYVVVERRVGGVAASGELILAWYEPAGGNGPGGITLKHWIRRGGKKILQGSTPESTFELKDGDIFELQGIVRRAYPPPLIFPKISG